MDFNKPYKPKWTLFFRNLPRGKRIYEPNYTSYEKIIKRKVFRNISSLRKKTSINATLLLQIINLLKVALRFREKKRHLKKALAQCAALLVYIAMFLSLLYLFHFKSAVSGFWNHFLLWLCFIISGAILAQTLALVTHFIDTVFNKIFKVFSYFLGTLFILCISYLFLILTKQQTNFVHTLLLALTIQFLIFSIFAILLLLIELFVDMAFYKSKLSLTQHLILEKAFSLSQRNTSLYSLSSNKNKTPILSDLEQLARLIELDWQNSIVTGDEHSSKWKRDTYSGIAASIRQQKKEHHHSLRAKP